VQGISISPDGARIAGFVFGRFEGTRQTPSQVVSIRVEDALTKRFALGVYAYGEVVWVNARTIAYLPGGADDRHVWLLNAETMRSVGGIDGWYAADSVVVGGSAFGIGWGQLARAGLDDGDVRLVRGFEGPETLVLDVVPGNGH